MNTDYDETTLELLIEDEVEFLTDGGHAFAQVVEFAAQDDWKLSQLLLEVWKSFYQSSSEDRKRDASRKLASFLETKLQRQAELNAVAFLSQHA